MRPAVTVIGAGSWGTTLASRCARRGPTTIWGLEDDVVAEINARRSNSLYLKGFELPATLRATRSLEDAAGSAEVIVTAVPSPYLRAVLEQAAPFVRPSLPIVSVTKGLEPGSLLRMTEVIAQLLPDNPRAVLSGPNLAREVMAGYAAGAVVACPDEPVAKRLQDLFNSGLYRVYTTRDVVGVELAGALKNVIAIAAGMADGVGVGDNTRALVITRGLAELTRLGVAMGGEAATFAGLAGLGDLLATCTSPLSRNRTVGEQLGKGRKLDEIVGGMRMVPEGVHTCALALELGRRHDIDMPITREIDRVVRGEVTALDAYRGLVRRPPGPEVPDGEACARSTP
ncbi:MAG TPA: NAD(P)H-dependent glycerol-3-phosphate dehydrogenase [Candidatus Binatia bacterium]|nr:NAD(P)H-dependent glycerol-3-phosphate dehydrogenase [Candidatus Binatia bacterium]